MGHLEQTEGQVPLGQAVRLAMMGLRANKENRDPQEHRELLDRWGRRVRKARRDLRVYRALRVRRATPARLLRPARRATQVRS